MMVVNYQKYFFSFVYAALLLLTTNGAQADATLLSHFQFDVCANGDLGTDAQGNNNGTITGSIALNKTPPAGIQTCSTATLSGGAIDVHGLPVSTNTGDKTSVSFWMYWDGTNNIMPIGWKTYDLWFSGGHFGFNNGASLVYGISASGLSNSWHHVVAVFTNGNAQNNTLYIDGVQQVLTRRQGGFSASNAVVSPHLRIGGWWNSNGYRFSGDLDEVKVYSGEMTQAQVNADFGYSETNCLVCPPDPPPELIGHYQFDVCSSSELGKDTLGLHDGTNLGGQLTQLTDEYK